MKASFPQIEKAVDKAVDLVKQDQTFIVLSAAMQSGKTEFISQFVEKISSIFTNGIFFYITAHLHKEFFEQNKTRLEHLVIKNLFVLSLRDRRNALVDGRSLREFKDKNPVFVFFDENHHGDAVEQTIHEFLTTNNFIPHSKVFLIGVSATPFSSIEKAGSNIIEYDHNLMPKYKGITEMLNQGDIKDATPLFFNNSLGEKVLDENNEAFLLLQKLITNSPGNFAIFRLSKYNAEIFKSELEKRYYGKVFVRYWNQSNPINNPNEYFLNPKEDLFTVVIVQNKARMGNTIATRFIRLLYEYSPKGSVATISQSLMGRACGHNKLQDDVKIFSHLKHAKSYSLFEQGKYQEFFDYMSENELTPSQRSKVSFKQHSVVDGSFTTSSEMTRLEIKRQVFQICKDKYKVPDDLLKNYKIRTFSKNQRERSQFLKRLEKNINPLYPHKFSKDSWNLGIFIDDRSRPRTVYFTVRPELTFESTIRPTAKSFYSTL